MGVDLDASLRSFLDDVASDKPTPGGGSVAALSGALAAALLSMVCRLTIGKKGYENVQEDMKRLLKEAEEARVRMQQLAAEDAEAYDRVAEAFRMDRSTPEAKERRRQAIQEALKGAAEVPLETAEKCVDVLRIAAEVAAKGNVNALSDAGTAAHLATAGFHGAAMNVEINLASIKGEDFVSRAQGRLEALEEEARRLHEEASRQVGKRLR
jgi:formiminotetrahydrofolate cyclodeaminase